MAFKVVTTTSFDREAKGILKKDKTLVDIFEKIIEALQIDPHNLSKHCDIKKLNDVPFGMGKWRIRSGNYRFRYEIDGAKVVLLSVKNRKDCYR